MHKTILFLFAFLITPITASYAVISNTEITVKPDYDGSGSISGGSISGGIGGTTTNPPSTELTCAEEEITKDGNCTKPDKCSDRSCFILSTQTNNKNDDFAKCVWVSKPPDALLVSGITSTDKQCRKKWYCKKGGYYTKVHTKDIIIGAAIITNQFSHVSCEPCPSACREDDTECSDNTTTQTPTQITGQIVTYSTAQSVKECYLRMQHTIAPNEITGSDEIGNFRTIKTDNSFICPY